MATITHRGKTIPFDEKLKLADEVENAVNGMLTAFAERLVAEGSCPCCIGRVIAGALSRPLGYHASAAIVSEEGVNTVLSMVRAAIECGRSNRAVANAMDIPTTQQNGGDRAH